MGAVVTASRHGKPFTPKRAQPDTGIYAPLRDVEAVKRAMRSIIDAPESGTARTNAIRLLLITDELKAGLTGRMKTRFNKTMKHVRADYARVIKNAGF